MKAILGLALLAASASAFAQDPAKLADKVKKGGSGVWGPVPMPPNPNVKDDDVKKMIQLIMNLKK